MTNFSGKFLYFSKKSNKIADLWLDHLQISIPFLKREYNLPGTKFHVDGYDHETKTVYEFQGDFWHGNPKIYDKDDTAKISNVLIGEVWFCSGQSNMAMLVGKAKELHIVNPTEFRKIKHVVILTS